MSFPPSEYIVLFCKSSLHTCVSCFCLGGRREVSNSKVYVNYADIKLTSCKRMPVITFCFHLTNLIHLLFSVLPPLLLLLYHLMHMQCTLALQVARVNNLLKEQEIQVNIVLKDSSYNIQIMAVCALQTCADYVSKQCP